MLGRLARATRPIARRRLIRMASNKASDPSPGAGGGEEETRAKSFATPGGAEFAALADWEHFREHGHKMVDFIVDYYKTVGERPVKSRVTPGYLRERLPEEAPEEPESVEAIFRDVEEHIMPGITHWQHPMFFSYFPANASYPGLLGDMLSGMFNVIGFSWIASPAATELETIVLDWLGKLVGLPDSFLSHGTGGGVIQGTASEATLVAVLASRARSLAGRPEGVSEAEYAARLRVYASDQAHSSVKKACMVAGYPLDQFRTVKARGPEFALDPADLRAAMEEDVAAGLVPCCCIATVGTTSSGAFDPLEGIGRVCQDTGAWLHVDAAWAGSAMICPEHRQYIAGVEHADSFDFNPHKWLLTNFDCSTMWVKNRHWLVHALSITPEYLRSKEYESGLVTDYRDWQVPLGRRFRALKIWFVLRCFGAQGLRNFIREHCALAAEFADLVRADDRFEIVTPPALGLVCFRLRGSNDQNEALLERVNSTGKMFLVHTVLEGQHLIRFSVGSLQCARDDIAEAWKLITEAAAEV